MTFDPTKPVRTRDGRAARILCTDLGGPYPIAARVRHYDGMEEVVYRLRHNGLVGASQCGGDLVNVPERHVRWVNLYSGNGAGGDAVHPSREVADDHAVIGRIACVRVEFEEGEGL